MPAQQALRLCWRSVNQLDPRGALLGVDLPDIDLPDIEVPDIEIDIDISFSVEEAIANAAQLAGGPDYVALHGSVPSQLGAAAFAGANVLCGALALSGGGSLGIDLADDDDTLFTRSFR